MSGDYWEKQPLKMMEERMTSTQSCEHVVYVNLGLSFETANNTPQQAQEAKDRPVRPLLAHCFPMHAMELGRCRGHVPLRVLGRTSA